MDQKLCFLLPLLLCIGSGNSFRPLHDAVRPGYADAASRTVAGSDGELIDPSLDYEISRVDFEPEVESYAVEPAAAPTAPPALTEPASSRKWWLPPSTMPTFPLFPINPDMPGAGQMPGATPFPAMPEPFRSVGWHAPRSQEPPSPAGSKDPDAN